MAVLTNVLGLILAVLRTLFARLRRGPLRPGWPLFTEALVAHLRRRIDALTPLDPVGQRAAFEALSLPSPVFRRVRVQPGEVAGVRGEWVSPLAVEPKGTVLYLHGGGFVTGSPRSHRELAARLALESGARLFVLDYRLAPEHPFPAALDDSLAAAKALLAQGPLVLAGDSAGANLCIGVLCALRDVKGPQAAGAALISAFVDCALRSASLEENEKFDMLNRPLAHKWVSLYLGGANPRDPRASPLNANLQNLPPLLVQIGGADMLHDEGSLFAKRAQRAGVQVRVEVEPDMPHDWHLLAGVLPQGRKSIAALGSFVREVTAAAERNGQDAITLPA